METAAIEIKGLSKRYKLSWKRKLLVALEGLDLRVEKGEVFGLLGPNGSGKSTTMKMVLGLIRPTAGEARIFGLPVDSLEAKQRLGFLPENPYFYRFLSGDETLRFYGRMCGVRGSKLEKKIDELIDLVGLESGRDRPLSSYSKGMLQRIGLAQALVHDPELLLLDEPTAGVDPIGSRDIRDIILRLKSMGKTVVFSSHLLDQVQDVADRVVILHQGRKLLEGRLDDLLKQGETRQMQVEGVSEAGWAEVRQSVERVGGRVTGVEQAQQTLESLFLRTVEGKTRGGKQKS
jgi:ABC-2 type transport system ATP-binding protein